MGWGVPGIGTIMRGARAIGSVAKFGAPLIGTVGKVGLKVGMGMLGGGPIGTAIALGTAGYGAYKAFGGGSSSGPGLPTLPGNAGGGDAGAMMNPNMGNRSIFRNDPNIAAQLQNFAIPMRDLRVCYRAPRGYVIRHDEKGDPYALPKSIARKFAGWKPAHKPPISVGDWHSLKRAGNVIDKFKDIEKEAKKIANFHAPRQTKSKQITMVEKGGKFVAIKG